MTRARGGMLLLAALLVAAAPLLLRIDGDYAGTDDQARAAIAATGYQPWAEPLWRPPSPQIESLLFALQAAAGAGLLGYVLGRRHGKAKDNDGRD